MKLAFSTLGCPSWDWNKIINEAEKNGYSGLELRGIEEEIYLPKTWPLLKVNQKETLQVLADKNLVITDLGAGSSFHDPMKYDASLQEAKDYIDLAAELKVAYIRIFGDKIPDPDKAQETFALIVKGINTICAYAAPKGVVCLMETHGDFASLETLNPIIKGIEWDNFGIIWDVGHTYKVYGNDVSEFLDQMWSYIKHVHIKDLKMVDGQLELCMIGDGVVPIPELVEALQLRGFEGFISLEWEKRWHPSLEDPLIAIPLYANYMRGLLYEMKSKDIL